MKIRPNKNPSLQVCVGETIQIKKLSSDNTIIEPPQKQVKGFLIS